MTITWDNCTLPLGLEVYMLSVTKGIRYVQAVDVVTLDLSVDSTIRQGGAVTGADGIASDEGGGIWSVCLQHKTNRTNLVSPNSEDGADLRF